MFDDRTFDTIMEEMLSRFGAKIRTDEGSLAYNACAKIAEKLEEIYADMEELYDNILPDTQDEFHLIEYGRERGLDYQYATCPVAKGVFRQEISIGERFTCNDYMYEVTGQIDSCIYELRCETEGTEANTNFGALEPVDYIDDYEGGEITEIISAGRADEDIEGFRQKVIGSFQEKAFCGNKADYRKFINEVAGVGGCKPKRREEGQRWIYIYVIGNDFNTPSARLLEEIQTLVDPEQNHGEGDGMAPICHNVLICPAEAETIDVAATVSFDTGFSIETSKDLIEAAISEYLLLLREEWESRGLENTVVRIRQVEAKILTVEGVLDVSGTMLNGSENNVEMDFTKIPILGGMTIV